MSRLATIAVTPTALDRNGLSTTETLLATRLDYLINGALSTGYDVDAIVASAVPVAATAMTLVAAGRDWSARKGAYILIDSGGGDETGGTFVILGTDERGNALREVITGPDANLIVLGAVRFWSITSVTPAGTLSGTAVTVGVNGYATFTSAQHMASFHAADDTGETVTFLGENRGGASLTETITGGGVGVTVVSTQNFGRIDRITASGAGAGATEAGVDGTCESQWYPVNYSGLDFTIGFGVTLSTSASLNYDVEHTFNDIFVDGFQEADAVAFNNSSVVNETTNQDGGYTNPPTAIRLAINAYTSGTATLRIVPSGGA